MEVYPICPVCSSEIELLDHILLSCSYAQHCWQLSMLGLRNNTGDSFFQSFVDAFKAMKLQDLQFMCCVAWNIWSHRNSVVWKNCFQNPAQIVNGAGVMLFQWQQAQIKQQRGFSSNDRDGAAMWQKPSSGWITCNVDAAVKVDSGWSSFGCVFRDTSGSFVSSYGGALAGIVDSKIVEVMAFREALSWLKSLQVTNVLIELDALSVVQAFHSKAKDFSYFGSIIQDCYSIVKDLGFYLVYFVRRSANVAAHSVAREASSLSDYKEWRSIPSFLIDVILHDMQ